MRKNLLLAVVALMLTASFAHAQLGTTAPTNNLTLTVGAEAALTISGGGSTPLTSVGTNFANYTGTTSMTYFIRTTESTGLGSIVLKVTSDFAGPGGPSVTTPPSAGDALTYGCTVAAPGTACTGPVTALTSGTTSVATFGAGAHSAKAGNAASVAWTLTNDPVYKTGAYSATVTITISAS
jgi:hypothetical protein